MASLLQGQGSGPARALTPESKDALMGWLEGALEEGFRTRQKNRYGLFVRERELDCWPSLGAFDFVRDAQLFANDEAFLLGVGRAKEWVFDSEKPLDGMKGMLERDELCSSPGLWILGGWSFSPSGDPKNPGMWDAFPSARWTIPALLFASTHGKNKLVLAADLSSGEKDLKRYYANLVDRSFAPSGASGCQMPAVAWSRDLPSRRRWVSLVRSSLASLSGGGLRKVVLSRAVKMRFESTVPPSVVLERLIKLNPDATVFAIRSGDSTFLGATPERLLSLQKGEVRVDCLAATAPRGPDGFTDESLGKALMEDDKSRREHELVVQGVLRSISPICSSIEHPEAPVLKKLKSVQHLHTPVRARLNRGVDIWSAAFSIWPTPATGGEPKEDAAGWIRDFEPVGRGWYSGVVGCVNASGDGDLVVAIRSAVVRRDTALLYAGAGIVRGSDPENEFEETGWKMRTMLRALSANGESGGI